MSGKKGYINTLNVKGKLLGPGSGTPPISQTGTVRAKTNRKNIRGDLFMTFSLRRHLYSVHGVWILGSVAKNGR